MTPQEIREASHKTRMHRLTCLRSEARRQKDEKRLVDEALLIVLESIKMAKEDPKFSLPDRPLAYLESILSEYKPGTFMELLKPRADLWLGWCKEFEAKGTSLKRKEQLRALLRKIGLITKKVNR